MIVPSAIAVSSLIDAPICIEPPVCPAFHQSVGGRTIKGDTAAKPLTAVTSFIEVPIKRVPEFTVVKEIHDFARVNSETILGFSISPSATKFAYYSKNHFAIWSIPENVSDTVELISWGSCFRIYTDGSERVGEQIKDLFQGYCHIALNDEFLFLSRPGHIYAGTSPTNPIIARSITDIYAVQTGKFVQRLQYSNRDFGAGAIDPTGSIWAVTSLTVLVRLHERTQQNGEPLVKFHGDGYPYFGPSMHPINTSLCFNISHIVVSPDSRYLCVSSNHTLQIFLLPKQYDWSVKDCNYATFEGHGDIRGVDLYVVSSSRC